MSTDDAVSKIRGKAGTEVKLKIIHPGQTVPKDLIIVRGKIEIKSVKFETKDVNGKKIALIKLNQFGDDTKGLLDRAIDTISKDGYSGLIVDMRNNPGGYLETAVSTISNWLDSEQVAVKKIAFHKNEKVY